MRRTVMTLLIAFGLVLGTAATSVAGKPAPAPAPDYNIQGTSTPAGEGWCDVSYTWSLAGEPKKPVTGWKVATLWGFDGPILDESGQPGIANFDTVTGTTYSLGIPPGSDQWFAVAPVFGKKVGAWQETYFNACPA
jgi:hypothetical protein